jgi:hypothetical protein
MIFHSHFFSCDGLSIRNYPSGGRHSRGGAEAFGRSDGSVIIIDWRIIYGRFQEEFRAKNNSLPMFNISKKFSKVSCLHSGFSSFIEIINNNPYR